MGQLLDVVASQLKIRVINVEGSISTNASIKKDTYKEVSEEIRELFKKEFGKQLYRKLRKMKVGEYIDYMFDCCQARPLGILMCDANDNLAEVLKELPELPEGERYVFPPNTYISFILTAKFPRQLKIKLELVSDIFIKAGLGQ